VVAQFSVSGRYRMFTVTRSMVISLLAADPMVQNFAQG